MTSKENENDEEDLYSDLPNFQYEDVLKKFEKLNKELLNDKQKLLQRIVELEKLVEETEKDKSEIQKKNNDLSFNVSSLYKTAQNEIKRKDRMIQELRKEKDDTIFRRQHTERRSRREICDEKNYEKYDKTNDISRNKSEDRHAKLEKNLEERRENSIDNKNVGKASNQGVVLKNSERNKKDEENKSQSSKKINAEIGEISEKTVSCLNLSSDEVYNLQKSLNDVSINMENNTKAKNEESTKNYQKNIPESLEPKNDFKMKSNFLPPKLNVPLTAYTKRMYKKHYGVSPEKVLQNELVPLKAKKEEFQADNNIKAICIKNISENDLVNQSEHKFTPEKSKMGKISEEKEDLSKNENTLPTLSQSCEENNSVRKPIRRISRVGNKIPEKNVSDFIKLGGRSISKKVIEQRIPTNSKNISKLGQTITPLSKKVTSPCTKQVLSSSLSLMIQLGNSKNEEESTSGSKVIPDETIESVVNRAKGLSSEEKQNVDKKTTLPSPKVQSIGPFKNKPKNKTTVINPVTNYNKGNTNKQSITESIIRVENKSLIIEPNVAKENNVESKVDTKKPKINACRKSRQAQFIDSLFGSPTKPEPRLKASNDKKPTNQNSEKSILSSEVINDENNTENKMAENTSPKETIKVCLNSDAKLPSESQKKEPDIKEKSQEDNKLSSASEVLTKLFQFHAPMTKSENSNLPATQLNSENSHKHLDNNQPPSTRLSTFKTSSPPNSMSGFIKGTENSCFSTSEDTIGMVTALARVRVQISPIKTPVKKATVPVESVDENASSPKVMTRARLRESVTNESNKEENKNYFSSISTSITLSQSPGKTTSEHGEFRRSKRVLALVKKPVTESIKTISLSPSKPPGFKRKINMSDSSPGIAETKRQKIDESITENKDLMETVKDLAVVSKDHDVIEYKKDNKIITLEFKNSKQCNDRENLVCRSDKEKVNEHISSCSEKKSNDRISPSYKKSSDRRRSSNERKLNKESNHRMYKTRSRGSSSPRHNEYDRSRATRRKRRLDHRSDKLRSKSVSSNEERMCDHRKKSLDLPKHRLLSSGNRSGFQRHSPSEFFNRKQKNSRRYLPCRIRRYGSPSPRYHRHASPRRAEYSSARKREKTEGKSEHRKESEDLRKDILNKESFKNVQESRELEKKQEPAQSQSNSLPHEPNWKLTLISVEESRKTQLTPSCSIEQGRCDPRMNICQSLSQSECSPQEVKLNRILTDQTNQSNQILSPDVVKPMATSNSPEKKSTKTALVINRRSRRNITFEDNTSGTKIESQNLKEDSTKCNVKTDKTEADVTDKLIAEQTSLNVTKEKISPDQNICALTTENVQKLNETLPSRCLDSSSIHTSNFPKKIVKTPLNFRQKYASVFSNSSNSSVDELDPFGNATDSDESKDSDRTWKP